MAIKAHIVAKYANTDTNRDSEVARIAIGYSVVIRDTTNPDHRKGHFLSARVFLDSKFPDARERAVALAKSII